MTETTPEALGSLQHRLQQVVSRLGATQAGAPFQQTLDALQQALAAAGLPDQPDSWMRSTTSQICAGQLVYLNAHEIPDELEHLEPDPDTHAAG